MIVNITRLYDYLYEHGLHNNYEVLNTRYYIVITKELSNQDWYEVYDKRLMQHEDYVYSSTKIEDCIEYIMLEEKDIYYIP